MAIEINLSQITNTLAEEMKHVTEPQQQKINEIMKIVRMSGCPAG